MRTCYIIFITKFVSDTPKCIRSVNHQVNIRDGQLD